MSPWVGCGSDDRRRGGRIAAGRFGVALIKGMLVDLGLASLCTKMEEELGTAPMRVLYYLIYIGVLAFLLQLVLRVALTIHEAVAGEYVGSAIVSVGFRTALILAALCIGGELYMRIRGRKVLFSVLPSIKEATENLGNEHRKLVELREEAQVEFATMQSALAEIEAETEERRRQDEERLLDMVRQLSGQEVVITDDDAGV